MPHPYTTNSSATRFLASSDYTVIPEEYFCEALTPIHWGRHATIQRSQRASRPETIWPQSVGNAALLVRDETLGGSPLRLLRVLRAVGEGPQQAHGHAACTKGSMASGWVRG